VHGQQNGSVYQQVTFGRCDITPLSPLAEDRAGVLKRCLDRKYANHSSHLRLRHTAGAAGPGQGL
jgi:hypothetical protein